MFSSFSGLKMLRVHMPFLFQTKKIPMAMEWRLNDLTFNDFSLKSDEMVVASIRIFKDLGFMKHYKIELNVSMQTSAVKNYIAHEHNYITNNYNSQTEVRN